MDQKVFFSQDGVTVSKARFIVRSELYEINQISLLTYKKLKPNRWVAMVCLAIGMLLVLDEGDFFAFGGCFILLGIVAWVATKPRYAIILKMPEGEVQALVSTDQAHVERVAQALNASRGMNHTENTESAQRAETDPDFSSLSPPAIE
jgi:hypothetical protein